MQKVMAATQQLGRALMLPIAVLPIAGLLLRLGQPDLLNVASIAAAGDAIFSNLGLLFAIGVAVGIARENHGAAGLAAVVGFLVATKGAEVLINVPPDIIARAGADAAQSGLAAAAYKAKQLSKLSVPIGIISGVIAGYLYNRYSDIRLPSYFAFFAGRRFVPILTGCAGIVVALVFGYGWPVLERGMDALSHGVIAAGSIGLFAYGVLNRILIVTGLHHILNNVAWFLVGDFNGATGDLKRFFAGDPSAGMFMSGFFPVMMFGLPAACLAMYHCARPERRRSVGGLLLSIALTSFLTGVTEPIEFTFMFLAPALYALHAALTGAAMVTMNLLDCHLGFGFSAGLFDYVLNFNRATNPFLLFPVGAAYAALYYFLFRFFIVRFGLKTPGREPEEAATSVEPVGDAGRAQAFIVALGGAGNMRSVDACTTRLRLTLVDREKIDVSALTRIGARGIVKVGNDGLQVVLGPVADQVAGDIRRSLAMPATPIGDGTRSAEVSTVGGQAGALDPALAPALLNALGGAGNISAIEAVSGRLLVTVASETALDRTALDALAKRGVAMPSPGMIHFLHADAPGLREKLAELLR